MTGIDWLAPGIYDDLPAAEYHQDPTRGPSLSASIASLFIAKSPLHAWCAHPHLNPDWERKDEAKFDVGTAAHALLLQGDDIVEVIEGYDDWRKQDARDRRDAARKAGLIPMLQCQWDETHAMVRAVHRQLADLELHPPAFADGKPEQTLIWEEDGVWCRARLDWLHDDHRTVDDYKSTGVSANPHVWSRRAFWSIGCDVQAAFHTRGLKHLTGHDADFRYIVAETTPPYAISVLGLAPSALELGQRKVDYAIGKWRECVKADHWPAYPREVALVELDPYADADFLRLTYAEEVEA